MDMFLFFLVLFLITLASLAYLAAAIGCLAVFHRRGRQRAPVRPPVTVLKPVCGLDEDLEENLRSFCLQDYPEFQVIFGVREADDPAIPVIRRLIAEFPGRDLSLVVDGRIVGANLKASNLANMLPGARHDLLLVADSDMRVDPGYLSAVAAPFADPKVGAVTCLYSGTPRGGLASALGALYITDWFLPAALVAAALQEPDFCFGATMAVRRQALAAIGGFEGLAPYLADDFLLGHRVRQAGWRVRIASYVVEDRVAEADLRSLLTHELRWARTVRVCRPLGYAFSFIGNNALSLACLFLLVSGFSAAGLLVTAIAVVLRLGLHFQLRGVLRVPPPAAPWLLPLRDLLCLAVWIASYFGREVCWRGRRVTIAAGGRLLPVREHRHLIITADDFGLSLPINQAVEEAHRHGVLTAASLMVGGETAADAVARARRLPQLRVGLHLVLTRGRPLLPPEEIPDLAGNGRFPDHLFPAGCRFFFRPAVRRQLAREIRAQFEAFRATGLPLDHVSVHNHMHLHPTVLGLLLRIGRDYGRPAVRLPWEPPLRPLPSLAELPGRLATILFLAPWAALLRLRLRRAGIPCNDRLYGIFAAGHLTADKLTAILTDLPAGVSEIHLHPAAGVWPGMDPATADWQPQEELAALVDPAVREVLAATAVRCGGYRDLEKEDQVGEGMGLKVKGEF